MANINAARASYFKHHPEAKEFWFCSDDLAYRSKEGAEAHGAALKRNKKKSADVDHITRDMVTEWEKTQETAGGEEGRQPEKEPTELERAQMASEKAKNKVASIEKNLADSKEKLQAAKDARTGLPEDAHTNKKKAADGKVAAAEGVVMGFEKALERAKEEADAANEAEVALADAE